MATEGGVLGVGCGAGTPTLRQRRLGCTVMTLEASKWKPLLAGFVSQHHPLCMCMRISGSRPWHASTARAPLLCMTCPQTDHPSCSTRDMVCLLPFRGPHHVALMQRVVNLAQGPDVGPPADTAAPHSSREADLPLKDMRVIT